LAPFRDIVSTVAESALAIKGEKIMKTMTALFALSLGLAATGFAAEFKGFIQDEKCSANPGMKGNAACAQKCIKGGDAAVLVGEDGKIYKIADQAKVVDHAGHNVTIVGSVKDDTITVDSVK
jgi:hypothetical protein